MSINSDGPLPLFGMLPISLHFLVLGKGVALNHFQCLIHTEISIELSLRLRVVESQITSLIGQSQMRILYLAQGGVSSCLIRKFQQADPGLFPIVVFAFIDMLDTCVITKRAKLLPQESLNDLCPVSYGLALESDYAKAFVRGIQVFVPPPSRVSGNLPSQ